MAKSDRVVIAGVDAHVDSHHVAALDEQGRLLGTAAFPATACGHAALLAWLLALGQIGRIGVESTGSYAAGLVRFLTRHGVEVLEINQPHPHTRRRRGKSDTIDAEAAARKTLTAERLALRPDHTRLHEPLQAAKLALRSVAERSIELNRDIRRLDKHLSLLVTATAPRTLSLLGVSTGHASTLLVAAGQNIDRLHSEAAFLGPPGFRSPHRQPDLDPRSA